MGLSTPLIAVLVFFGVIEQHITWVLYTVPNILLSWDDEVKEARKLRGSHQKQYWCIYMGNNSIAATKKELAAHVNDPPILDMELVTTSHSALPGCKVDEEVSCMLSRDLGAISRLGRGWGRRLVNIEDFRLFILEYNLVESSYEWRTEVKWPTEGRQETMHAIE